GPMADFLAGGCETTRNDLGTILGTSMEPLSERGCRGREHEYAHEVGGCRGCKLLRTLPIDVEEHIATGAQGIHHLPPRRTIKVAVHVRPLEQIASFLEPLESRSVDEMIVLPIDFAGPRLAGRHRN